MTKEYSKYPKLYWWIGRRKVNKTSCFLKKRFKSGKPFGFGIFTEWYGPYNSREEAENDVNNKLFGYVSQYNSD